MEKKLFVHKNYIYMFICSYDDYYLLIKNVLKIQTFEIFIMESFI